VFLDSGPLGLLTNPTEISGKIARIYLAGS
jgi:hypothetical protein